MFEYKIPTFNPAPLRKDILVNMRELSLQGREIRYDGYSDGIVHGCRLFEENMNIGIHSGMVKFAGRLYTLTERRSVPYQPTDTWTLLKIQFGGEASGRDFIRYTGELVLDDNTSILPNEMELARFKLKQGSRLRTEYVDFEDMRTEYDTVNLIYVQQAFTGTASIHPEVIGLFAREAYPLAQEADDIAFCSQVLARGETLAREYIQQYIARRRGQAYKELDNEAVFDALTEILGTIQTGAGQAGPAGHAGMLLL